MKTVEEIKAAIEAAVPGAGVEVVPNPSPSAQHSLRLAPASAVAVATFLRDDAELAFDFLSNVSGVDWPDKEIGGGKAFRDRRLAKRAGEDYPIAERGA